MAENLLLASRKILVNNRATTVNINKRNTSCIEIDPNENNAIYYLLPLIKSSGNESFPLFTNQIEMIFQPYI